MLASMGKGILNWFIGLLALGLLIGVFYLSWQALKWFESKRETNKNKFVKIVILIPMVILVILNIIILVFLINNVAM